MKIMFMGTPDFACEILKSLYESHYDIIAVVTQTDKPKGRGYILQPPPVKEYAERNGLKVYQPNTLRSDDFYTLLGELSPDLIIVAAYGKILPANILTYAKYGCINVHASILPKYRGAAPIQRAIINGEKVTGVTIMQMDEGIDTGDMLLKAEIEITDNDNFETVHDRLAKIGGQALIDTLVMLERGEVNPIKQNDAESSYAAKIEKSDCLIDFNISATAIHNKIRGLSPFPLSYSVLNGKKVKLVSSAINYNKSDLPNATVVSLDKGVITVACGENLIDITAVLPEGKSKMSSADFINGRKIKIGDKFGVEK